MSVEGRKALAFFMGLLMTIFLLVYGISRLDDMRQADISCFSDLKAVYTWDHRMSELDDIWKDHKITIGECNTIQDIYHEAQAIDAAAKADAEIQAIRKGQR